MEAPIAIKEKDTIDPKTFKLTSNKGNDFILTFKSIKSDTLLISAMFDDKVIKTFFESEFTLQKIQENKAFSIYDSIAEILNELLPLIDDGKINLLEDEENEVKVIKIIFELPFKKYKNIDFVINEKKKTNKEQIDELYNIIIIQNKEISNLKENFDNMKTNMKNLDEKINDMEKRISNLEKDKKEILKHSKFENDFVIKIKSNIFSSFDEIDFIIERLKNDIKLRNKKISFNLLFKATRDGEKGSYFHKKCNGKVQQLIFIKSTKGEIFGGYTEIGFRSRGGEHKDNNSFVFSFSTKKIYDIQNDCVAIYDDKDYGPCFAGKGAYTIYIYPNMFNDKSHTNKSSESNFKGIKTNYEINNGEEYFYIQEIEVYQVLYS